MNRLVTLCSIACACALSSAHASSILFSTFSDDKEDLFNCCSGYDVIPYKDYVRQDVGAAFTAPVDAELTKIDLALTGWKHLARHRELILQVRDTDGFGAPGATLREYTLEALPRYHAPCCTFVTKHMRGLPISAGKTYWVVVKADFGLPGDWQYNTGGYYGTMAENNCTIDSCWRVIPGALMPAFRLWVQ